MRAEIVDIEEFKEIIIAYANGDFSKRMDISNKRDERDIIVSGVNMLGEELEQTTISRDYFSSIYNAVSDMLIVTDTNGLITDVNNTVIHSLGFNKDYLIGKDARSILALKDKVLEDEITNAVNEGKSHYHFETTFANSIKTHIPVSCSISVVINRFNENNGFLIIAKDITEKKLNEQHLLKVVVSTQEKERKRLAYDLHDSLGQELNAVKMYLNSLDIMDKSSIEFNKAFEECKIMLDQSIDTIRDLSYNLMPKSLEQGNLCQALIQLAKAMQNVITINCNFQQSSLGLDKETQILIYRIVQEFINNSIKHSKSESISITIIKQGKKIDFALEDAGIGFDSKQRVDGNGLHNMKSRLKAINAYYTINSIPKKGTYLNFSLRL